MTQPPNFSRFVTTWLPPVAGVALIVLFASLASWQLDRAAEKEALADLFDPQAEARPLAETDEPPLFVPVTTSGRYLGDRQFLIDNVIRNSSLGYYVITPFEQLDGSLLLVNRGWIGKPRHSTELPEIAVADDVRRIRARVGRLPRVALRSGEAISPGQDWPRRAVYPRIEDIAASLGRDVSTPVLLLDGGEDDGYVRDWQPEEQGSMMHYGYAFQWSALAVTVLIVLIWQTRKRLQRKRRTND